MLTDHHGHDVTDSDYRGRFLLVYFGFTHCRDVCPRALARLSEALSLLHKLADRIQPLYVTVDPTRDTPAVMKAYLETQYPRFTGLTGTPEQVDAAKSTFRVFARRGNDPDDPAGYAVPHSALSYLVDPDGRYIAHFSDTIESDPRAPAEGTLGNPQSPRFSGLIVELGNTQFDATEVFHARIGWGSVARSSSKIRRQDSLIAPGGNITGMMIIDVALTPKRFELIREVVPSAVCC